MSPTKKELRLAIKNRAEDFDLADSQRAGTRIAAICETFLWRHLHPDLVMCYVSMKGEAPTRDIIRACLIRGQRVCVPWVEPETMDISASELENFNLDLAPGCAGILEPRDTCRRPVSLGDIDVHLVPGMAFDFKGARLGRGAGCYDRFLAGCGEESVRIGIAFSWQVIDDVPSENHDIPMDWIITEEGIIPAKENREAGEEP